MNLPTVTPHSDAPVARVASLGGSAVISLLILYGIARAQQTAFVEPDPLREELRAFVDDSPPPPPPPASAPVEPPPLPELNLPPEPSSGGIQIFATMQPPAPPVPPLAEIRFDLDLENFRPTPESSRGYGRPVYRVSEVDRRPVAIRRTFPGVLQSTLDRFENPHVVLLFIVTPNGRADEIQVLHAPNQDIGEAAVAAMEEWKFRPALKDGQKVRCLVQQTILLGDPDKSPFSR